MHLYENRNKRGSAFVAAVLILSIAVLPTFASAAIVEPDRDVQLVMGDLYALSLAMRIYYDSYDGAPKTKSKAALTCPTIDQLARYFKTPLPPTWREDYRTATVDGAWWVGRKVPEFSRARKFLRENAPSLRLYDKEIMSVWMGGSYVWTVAVSFGKSGVAPGVRVAQGEDKQRLFFNSPGTEYYWWSNLLYTPNAQAAALKKFGDLKAGPFRHSPSSCRNPRDLFRLSRLTSSIKMGDLIVNPLPHMRD